MSLFASGGWHSRTAARGNASASADCSRRQPSNPCACRRRGHVRNRASRWFDHVGIPIETKVALSPGGASSARVATIGRTSTYRAIHAPAPSFVRPVLAHRPAGLVSRAVLGVVGIRSGSRSCRYRAAWRVHRVVVVLSDVAVCEGSCRLRVSFGRFAENGGMSHVSPFRASATGHGNAPLGGSFERHGSRARSRRRSLIRAAVQHANGTVAPDGPVLSCRHGARLICSVRRTKTDLHSDPRLKQLEATLDRFE